MLLLRVIFLLASRLTFQILALGSRSDLPNLGPLSVRTVAEGALGAITFVAVVPS